MALPFPIYSLHFNEPALLLKQIAVYVLLELLTLLTFEPVPKNLKAFAFDSLQSTTP